MKNQTTILIVLFSFFYSSSLSSQSFIDEGNQWTTTNSDFMGNIYTTTRKIEGDTLLNGTLYKKMWRTSDNPINNNWILDQFIREDSTKKVFTNIGNLGEELMYDFGLVLGDTIYSHYDSTLFARVEAVDSIILNDGTIRRRVNIKSVPLATGVFEEFWIEGVGGENIAFLHLEPFWITDTQNNLRCFSSNGTLLYGGGTLAGCFVPTSTDDPSKLKFEIYPNPSSEFLYLNFDESLKIKAARIFNLQGQLVNICEPSHQLDKIDISNLPAGAFFLQLTNDEGISDTQRFIKM